MKEKEYLIFAMNKGKEAYLGRCQLEFLSRWSETNLFKLP